MEYLDIASSLEGYRCNIFTLKAVIARQGNKFVISLGASHCDLSCPRHYLVFVVAQNGSKNCT